jgi:hypothetical protein
VSRKKYTTDPVPDGAEKSERIRAAPALNQFMQIPGGFVRAVATLALAALPAAAGTPPTPAHVRTPAASKAAPTAPARLDAAIEKDIRARLARSKINVDKFEVRVQGGIATLTGRTDVVQHKGTATRLAKSGGATAVLNKIQVSQAAKDRVAGNLANGRRRAQIKRGEARADR